MKIETAIHIVMVTLAITLMACYDGPGGEDMGSDSREKAVFADVMDAGPVDGARFQFASAAGQESADGAHAHIWDAERSSR